MSALAGRHIVVGVSAGIAAYKTCDLVSRLIKQQAAVQVVMTPNATRFVGPMTFEALSGRPVFTELWSAGVPMSHIEMADRADLMAIAPATADVIAKMAHGIADDALTTTVLTVECPILVAPAMNTRMLQKPVTQQNLAILRDRGVEVLASPEGMLACGTAGAGRMAEPPDIVEAIEKALVHR
jgi:phosphopantothenoylcysteine decarboxylase/phosphopantothenate--cysteine ligase